jgi:hypothetical protein
MNNSRAPVSQAKRRGSAAEPTISGMPSVSFKVMPVCWR